MLSRNGLAIFVLLALLVVAPLTAYLAYQNQNIQPKAVVSGGVASLSLSPSNLNFQVGETKQVKVLFETGGKAVNGVQAVLKYPYTGSSPQVEVSNLIMDQSLRTSSNGDWACSILNIDNSNSQVTLEITCANSSLTGYISNSPIEIASFDLKANGVPTSNPFTIAFDSTNSFIYEKVVGSAQAVDILQNPTSTVSVSVGSVSTGETHKVCFNRACTVMKGSGPDECSTVGQSCEPVFKQEAVTGCTGRFDPNCYNCVDDDGNDEINILDFACFRSAFGQKRTSGIEWE